MIDPKANSSGAPFIAEGDEWSTALWKTGAKRKPQLGYCRTRSLQRGTDLNRSSLLTGCVKQMTPNFVSMAK